MPETKNPETPAATKDEPTLDSRLAAVEAALASFTAKLAELSGLTALSTKLDAIETVANGFSKSLEEQKTAFEKRLTEQATKFTSALKSADVLASRKLAATGVPAGKAPPAESGEKVLDFQAALLSFKEPRELQAFYHKHKEKIHAQFGRKQ